MLGIPTYSGEVRAELLPFVAEFRPEDIVIIDHRPVDCSRNLLVNEAQRRNADVLFMVDADAVPKKGTYQALLEQATQEICVVGCPYFARGRGVPVRLANQTQALNELQGLQAVENLGTHCLAYNMQAFNRIKPPYFEHKYNERHTVCLDTEDFVCHSRMRAAGVPLYVHFDYWAGHSISELLI